MNYQLLIGATNSGCGKTTITMGLLRVLAQRGLNVQPFKCGPDYIDTHYHAIAAHRESINLDLWLSSKSHVITLYNKYSAEADVSLTEGVMGLYDGYDKMKGSSADIAVTLGIPVVLIVNASSMAYSVAPILYGYKHFFDKINIAGVIFNKTGSEQHNCYLEKACKDVGIECLGCLPKTKEIEIPSRHLGLTLNIESGIDELVEKIADQIKRHINIDRLLEVCECESKTNGKSECSPINKKQIIAIAQDEAFNFTYKENIDRLKELGDIHYFSPINDEQVPSADFVYLPGGYPEFFLKELSQNANMLNSIKEYAERGGRLLAECGGMMYLCKSIIGIHGEKYMMANIFHQEATMESMHLHLGYRRFTFNGIEWKGHEFHYSSLLSSDKNSQIGVTQYNAKGDTTDTAIYRHKNAIASYTHLYWGENNIMDLFNQLS